MYGLPALWAHAGTAAATNASWGLAVMIFAFICACAGSHLAPRVEHPMTLKFQWSRLTALGFFLAVWCATNATMAALLGLTTAFLLCCSLIEGGSMGCGVSGPTESVFEAMTLEVTASLPMDTWGVFLYQAVACLRYLAVRRLVTSYTFYQALWYGRRHRRVRRRIRKVFEAPLRFRRYWFLILKERAGYEAAWVGFPMRRFPRYHLIATIWGPVALWGSALLTGVLTFLGLTAAFARLQALAWVGVAKLRRLWANRPSLFYTLCMLLKPEAPIAMHRGERIVPPRRSRLTHLFSDMESFASYGSGLLTFMFLIWSFFARILLVLCFLSLF